VIGLAHHMQRCLESTALRGLLLLLPLLLLLHNPYAKHSPKVVEALLTLLR